ncbi:hypothetical protein E2C01_014987 [Portunus trituberculatus]|uniref:Uncharacterized protein n=1 Tax=Portunus trituberculatus TaxID=210409 RepID=A0A5B7DLL5_PORTR|nr:hypothetical protein [Portunus trituberculatus]
MEARSNWLVESVVELRDAIQESTKLPSEDLAELLDEEKCFSLTRPEDGEEWCYIKLGGNTSTVSPWQKPRSSKLIKGILLHSEARVVEVCVGAHDEYLKTVHGRKLGQYEDTVMCACEVQVDPPRQEVLLTFKHTYNVDCVWVFGLHVMTTEEQVRCSEGRFSGGHLTSVLKEKDVNVSKDAAKFLSMLESYNGAGFNENNQLALMSMFLGPKVVNDASFNAGVFGKGDGKQSNVCVEGNDSKVTAVDEANSNSMESKMKELAITSEEGEINNKPSSEGNNNNTGNLYKETIKPKSQTMPSVGSNDGLLEKLFTLMGDTQGQHSVTKAEASPPPTSAHDSLKPPGPSSHLLDTLLQSLGRIPPPVNNFHPTHSAAPGPAHSTPRARGVGSGNVWPADGGCEGLSLEESGLLLKEIENMIDRKFAQMEERLVRRIEEKIVEKTENDSKRLEKIEEHLSKLCEHLQR